MTRLLIAGLLLVALLLYLHGRTGLTKYLPWVDFGGKQPADVNAMRVLEDDVTELAGQHPPKDLAP